MSCFDCIKFNSENSVIVCLERMALSQFDYFNSYNNYVYTIVYDVS